MKRALSRLKCSNLRCSSKAGFWARKPKPSFICSSIFHLYHSLDILKEHEIVAYKALEAMLKYDITSNLKPKAKERTNSHRESLSLEEIGALQSLYSFT